MFLRAFSTRSWWLGAIILGIFSGILSSACLGGALDEWVPRNPALTSSGLRGVTFGRDMFVAVGEGGTILTSPDGVAWTPRNSGTGQWIVSVAYGGDVFVAVCEVGTVLTSTDGLT